MSTFVLIHGGGTRAATFTPLVEELELRGHEVIAPDLPIEDATAGLSRFADTVVDAIGERGDVVVVGHSFGGMTAPIVAERVGARLLVLLSAMIPRPGETASEWWEASGWTVATQDADFSDEVATFLHDIPHDAALRQLADHGRAQADRSSLEPWPLEHWPDVSTRVLAFADDRFYPVAFQRRLAAERLGLELEETPGGHCGYLSETTALADRLERYLEDS